LLNDRGLVVRAAVCWEKRHAPHGRVLPGEAATREAIASTKEKELLSQTGGEFELSLLLTQAESLSYALHLARVAIENEFQPDRACALGGVSEDMASRDRGMSDQQGKHLANCTVESDSPCILQGKQVPDGGSRNHKTTVPQDH
jgi:hypothetical protein